MINEISGIVKEVGNLLLKWRNNGIIEGQWDGSQFKAKVDQMAHFALTERLKKIYPDIPIISEEDISSHYKIRPEIYWIIDPIDGTSSFVEGYEGFVTQISLIVKNLPVLAAIYAPLLELLYTAKRGHGAFLNNERLATLKNKEPKILIDNYPEPRGIARELYNDLCFARYIECGSISLKICKVADGTADVFFKNVTVKDWDIAAPHLILEEAGGVLKDNKGEEIRYTGDFTHKGIVAASSDKTILHIVLCYNNLKRKECHSENTYSCCSS
ncbi:MAG: 3'(2'),5'-bisphosphate nucleotidase CysQ [Deltaproteobacteria bacterium]|nr:3'(2'),5'-bisphosphate nucleotidase CysQ [Deltaproteobacteria bacterium]